MRRIGPLVVLLMWLASAAVPARAQAPEPRPIAGSAANLVRLAGPSLALKAQVVELTFLPEQRGWDISAHFEIANPGDRPAQAQLALPEFRCDPEAEFDDHCDPSQSGFAQLSATVRGRLLRLRKTPAPRGVEPQSGPDQLWDFPLTLAAGESVPVDLQYAVPAGLSNDGGFSASYRLRGGVSWAKPIGRATFKFSFPAYSCIVIEPESLTRRSRRVLLRDGAPWLELTFDAYVWNAPPAIALYFEPCLVARDSELPGCPAASELQRYFFPAGPDEELEPITGPQLREALARLGTAQLGRCRDAVFEAYAGYFDASELRRLPSHPETKRHFTAPLLTDADWKWVHYLDARLAERPPEPPPSTAAEGGAPVEARGCGCRVARPGASPAALAAWLALVFAITIGRRRSNAKLESEAE